MSDTDAEDENRVWQDLIVRERMEVDQEFSDRVFASQFSRQDWSLIMTAVELKIEGENEAEARIVADTSKVKTVIPHLGQDDGMMGGSGGSSGLLSSIKSALSGGSGSDGDAETLAAANELADEYADELEAYLKENGKWGLVASVGTR